MEICYFDKWLERWYANPSPDKSFFVSAREILEVLHRNRRLIGKILKRYHVPEEKWQYYLDEIPLMMLKDMKTYNPEKGRSLTSYIYERSLFQFFALHRRERRSRETVIRATRVEEDMSVREDVVTPSIAELVSSARDSRRVRRVLLALPEREQLIIRRIYYDDLDNVTETPTPEAPALKAGVKASQ